MPRSARDVCGLCVCYGLQCWVSPQALSRPTHSNNSELKIHWQRWSLNTTDLRVLGHLARLDSIDSGGSCLDGKERKNASTTTSIQNHLQRWEKSWTVILCLGFVVFVFDSFDFRKSDCLDQSYELSFTLAVLDNILLNIKFFAKCFYAHFGGLLWLNMCPTLPLKSSSLTKMALW